MQKYTAKLHQLTHTALVINQISRCHLNGEVRIFYVLFDIQSEQVPHCECTNSKACDNRANENPGTISMFLSEDCSDYVRLKPSSRADIYMRYHTIKNPDHASWYPEQCIKISNHTSLKMTSDARMTCRYAGTTWERYGMHLEPRLLKMNVIAWTTVLWCWDKDGSRMYRIRIAMAIAG